VFLALTVALHEFTPQRASLEQAYLEQAYMQLTRDAVEYRDDERRPQ
jgi:hypothetical protein